MLDKVDTVYIIDPDAAIREALSALLGTLDIPVICYADAQQFLDVEAPKGWAGSCILVEAELRGLSCLEFLKRLRDDGNTLPVLVLASTSNRVIANQALRAGATDVIDKPLVNDHFVSLLHRSMNRSSGLDVATAHRFGAKNGTEVTIRAIRPEDADIEQAFVRSLSARSRYLRFFSSIKQLSPRMLERFTRPGYPHDWALIATIVEAGQEKEIGVARYAPSEKEGFAEFAVAVADAWQGLGVARHLLCQLINVAEQANIWCLEGFVLRENTEMLRLAKKLGFTAERDPDDATVVNLSRSLSAAGDPQSRLRQHKQ